MANFKSKKIATFVKSLSWQLKNSFKARRGGLEDMISVGLNR